jgi:hypothetical protein
MAVHLISREHDLPVEKKYVDLACSSPILFLPVCKRTENQPLDSTLLGSSYGHFPYMKHRQRDLMLEWRHDNIMAQSFVKRKSQRLVSLQSRDFWRSGGDTGRIRKAELSKALLGKHFSAIYLSCKSLSPLRIGMVMIAHKISTVRPWSGLIDLIKRWKYSRRIDPFDPVMLVDVPVHKSPKELGVLQTIIYSKYTGLRPS